jgi:hypothetical protein
MERNQYWRDQFAAKNEGTKENGVKNIFLNIKFLTPHLSGFLFNLKEKIFLKEAKVLKSIMATFLV